MDLCEFYLELVEWIASPHDIDVSHTRLPLDEPGWKGHRFEKPAHLACQLCVELTQSMTFDAYQVNTFPAKVEVFGSTLQSAHGLWLLPHDKLFEWLHTHRSLGGCRCRLLAL
jgi:hypothetical protein